MVETDASHSGEDIPSKNTPFFAGGGKGGGGKPAADWDSDSDADEGGGGKPKGGGGGGGGGGGKEGASVVPINSDSSTLQIDKCVPCSRWLSGIIGGVG